jgi:hypothetical protein
LSSVGKITVLLLDEINILRQKELQDIEEYLLESLILDNERAILITAGRVYPRFISYSLQSINNIFALSVFDEKTTGEQLELLRPGAASLAGKILELGDGVPINNAKLASQAIGDPPNIPNELQAVQTLLADLKSEIEERFHPVIEAICILQVFYPEDAVPLMKYHPALGEEWDEAKIKAVFPELKEIQIGPGGLIQWDKEKKSWAMDEPTRALFERELRMRAPQLWSELHYVAYKMYEGWGVDYNSQAYKDKAIYHQRCLQSAGYDPAKHD